MVYILWGDMISIGTFEWLSIWLLTLIVSYFLFESEVTGFLSCQSGCRQACWIRMSSSWAGWGSAYKRQPCKLSKSIWRSSCLLDPVPKFYSFWEMVCFQNVYWVIRPLCNTALPILDSFAVVFRCGTLLRKLFLRRHGRRNSWSDAEVHSAWWSIHLSPAAYQIDSSPPRKYKTEINIINWSGYMINTSINYNLPILNRWLYHWVFIAWGDIKSCILQDSWALLTV